MYDVIINNDKYMKLSVNGCYFQYVLLEAILYFVDESNQNYYFD